MPASISYTWPAVILWIGLYQSLVLVPVLLFRRGENQLANQLLAGFIGLMGCRLVSVITLSGNLSPMWEAWISLINPVTFLYGPIFYFYVRAFLERNFQFRKVHLWHLLPMGGAIFMYLLAVTGLIDEPLAPPVPPPPLPHRDVPIVFFTIRLIYGLMFLGYLVLGIRLIVRFRRRVREEASFSEAIHLRWLSFLAAVLLLPLASVLLTALAFYPPPASPSVKFISLAPYPAYGVALTICIFAVITFLKPEVLEGLPEALKVEDEDDLAPKRYESSALTEDQKQRYLRQLQTHMDKAKPYLHQELTLSMLADQLKINNKYLSQVINEKLEQNFLDYINGYRVARAQELLLDQGYQHYTVVAIAHEVGFKSKSAFYTAFKKQTDMTPSAWRKKKE